MVLTIQLSLSRGDVMAQRTWFITGSSSGFGRLMTEQLLSRGDRVAATARNVEALRDVKEEHGESLWLASLDVTDAAQVRAVVKRAFAGLGRIDVVVSNAGYGLFGAAEELTDEQIDQQIGTNLLGPIQLVRAALPGCEPRAGAASSRSRPTAVRRSIRERRSITQVSGGLRGSWNPPRWT
jgi:NAD(P)-dependent dehydrogenase (short-subunit alcohol dehydrogenase family)